MSILPFRRKTYVAKPFEAPCGPGVFKLSGRLDGYVDFALPVGKTYQLTIGEARALLVALNGVLADVEHNCLHDQDALLARQLPSETEPN